MAYVAQLLPMPRLHLSAASGGALAYFYQAGTTTPLDTYSEHTLTVGNENANPVEADAAGLFPAIYLLPRAYKLVLKTSAGVTIFTQDYIAGETPTNILSKTTNYTITPNDGRDILLLADASGGSFTVTLPALASSLGTNIRVIKTDSSANTVTVDGAGAETINGDASLVLDEQGEILAIVATALLWYSLASSAAAKPCLVWTALGNQPPASAYATLDSRNSHPVLDFDGSTDEEAVFGGVLSPDYEGGGLTCEIWVGFTSATTGTSRWQAAIERIDASGLDIDADSFASFQSAAGAAPALSGQFVKVSITFTAGAQMDSLAAGEAFRLKIRRDADGTSGTDDVTTDAEVLRVVLREP